MMPRRHREQSFAPILLLALLSLWGCAPAPAGKAVEAGPSAARSGKMLERPVADGPWRLHLLSRCAGTAGHRVDAAARDVLIRCGELFRYGEGGDGIVALEMYLAGNARPDPLVLLTLGQLYVMAGQGVPELVPGEGPAADTGDWERNRKRFLARARTVLESVGELRPDDSAVDYLIADALRAGGDLAGAETRVAGGMEKCTIPASMDILARYQELLRTPAAQIDGPAPDYPAELADRGIAGDVVQDLLVAPDGTVAQVETIRQPDRRLARSAARAHSQARFSPARVGKYPVWSWARVTTRFGAGED